MPQFTSILADREPSPLTPIPETDIKDADSLDVSLTLTKSPESFPSLSDSDSPSASPPSSRGSSATSSPIASPPQRKVSFPTTDSPVTSMSRPLNNAELWPLYHFEQHARSCRDCFNPYAVHKEGKSLCPTGQEQGAKVAQIIYSKCDGQDIFAVSDLGSCDLTRVELPRQYVQVRSLLRAVERIVKARRRPERKRVVEREDEAKLREMERSRQHSPDRSRRSEPQQRYYRATSPTSDHDRQESPRRTPRSITRSYHESELPLRRRASSSPSSTSSSASSSPTRSRPIDIINNSSSRPSLNPTHSSSGPHISWRGDSSSQSSSAPPRVSSATYPPARPTSSDMSPSNQSAALPFRRRSLTDGPSNAFPSRRSSVSGPPSSYKYSSSAPFRPSPLSTSNMTRSPSWREVPTLKSVGRSGSVETSRATVNVEVRRPSPDRRR